MVKRKITKSSGKKNRTAKSSSVLKKTVSELYELMLENNLSRVTWTEKKGSSITLVRQGAESTSGLAVIPQSDGKKPAVQETPTVDTADYIRSPMNGVFYRSPTPGTPPFVNEGDEITPGSTVCIIEAMKLMNEVQIERHCTIKKILVNNAEAVKVNQPLFEVENI